MIKSMTGFGRGMVGGEGLSAVVEIRSVNSRYAEVSIRMPQVLHAYEQEVQSRVRQRLERGKIQVHVQVEREQGVAVPIRVNAEAAAGYSALLHQLREVSGIEGPVRLEHLLQFSEVFTSSREQEQLTETQWEVVRQALEQALEAIDQMRQYEGEKLQGDIEDRIRALEERLTAIEARAPERVREAHERLRERVEALLSNERLVPERLEMEIALLADRLDITEECVRLRSHLDFFREALAKEEAVGRRLNFLIQEIHREINTIGSKANDAAIARKVVEMKEELEKIREQVQNIL